MKGSLESGSAPRWREVLVGAAAAAVLVVLAFYFPDRDDASGAIFGGIFAFGAVAVGLAATGRARPLPSRSASEYARLLALSIVAGAALGT